MLSDALHERDTNVLPAAPSAPSTPLRDTAWHGQLQLLTSLPHSLLTLAPAIAASVRSGMRADFASIGLCDSATLTPTGFWTERVSEALLYWLGRHADELLALTPLTLQRDSDGQAVRDTFDAPGWSTHPVYQGAFGPLGARWGTGVPLLDRQDRCLGFIYLYRAEAEGRFSDAEQRRLRDARDRLRGLASAHAAPGTRDTPTVPTRSALLRIDAQGRIRARSADAYELLFLGQHQQLGSLTWAAADLTALPAPVAERARQLLDEPAAPACDELTLRDDGGGMRYRMERLIDAGADAAELVLTLCHLEPIDLAVALQLTRWPLTPRERQLAVASARTDSQREMASALGCSLGTLKGYMRSLYAKLGVASREAMIERLLAGAASAAPTSR